jgi:hypothetical protein
MSATIAAAAWLEIVEGPAPILLIAPHGGRAGAAARAALHPKVNDLETAAIARELADRLGACALINSAMDRNELDCNRLGQLAARAPWMLELIASRVEHMARRRGRAIVMLIHGWNVIEPRVDIGLGLRDHGAQLRPPAGAHVSASDDFISGPVSAMAERLDRAGIAATFGMRYPGGARQNLLQAFTPRHRASDIPAVRRLAALAADGAVDAVQLEMSVAVRMPGPLRAKGIAAIAESFRFAHGDDRAAPATGSKTSNGPSAARVVIREAPPRSAKAAAPPAAAPTRYGVEFFDAAANIGGIASFDLGAGGAGGRIMILFDRCRAALFTAEGRPHHDGETFSLGPLRFACDGRAGSVTFAGPAIVVNDGGAYLSVEHALAGGALDPAMRLRAALALEEDAPATKLVATAPRFGRLQGAIEIAGRRLTLDAVARVGVSVTGLGAGRFEIRRTIWARFASGSRIAALEACETAGRDRSIHRDARIMTENGWRTAEVGAIELTTREPAAPPDRIAASIVAPRGAEAELSGAVRSFMSLSRPGADGVRIHTTLGFAEFSLGGERGAGMFEYSRVVGRPDAAMDEIR